MEVITFSIYYTTLTNRISFDWRRTKIPKSCHFAAGFNLYLSLFSYLPPCLHIVICLRFQRLSISETLLIYCATKSCTVNTVDLARNA